MLKKTMLLTGLLSLTAFADDRYTVKKVGEDAWVVTDSTNTSGNSQTSGVYNSEAGAKQEANKQNKQQKKTDKKLEKAGLK